MKPIDLRVRTIRADAEFVGEPLAMRGQRRIRDIQVADNFRRVVASGNALENLSLARG